MFMNQENLQSNKKVVNTRLSVTSDYSVITKNYDLFKDKLGYVLTLLSNNQNDQSLQELNQLLKEFPDEPLLLDYLAAVYKAMENEEMYKQVIYNNYRQFPYFLFIRCSYADLCLQEKRHTEAAKAVEYRFNLADLYPKKELFHIMEIIVFESFLTRYFCALKEYNRAMSCIHNLYMINPSIPQIKELSLFVLSDVLDNHLSIQNMNNLLFKYMQPDAKSCNCENQDCDCNAECGEECSGNCNCNDKTCSQQCNCQSGCKECDCGCHNE